MLTETVQKIMVQYIQLTASYGQGVMMDLFTQNSLTCSLEPRLRRRYELLLKDHLNAAPKLAQGVKALSHHETAWANTQAAWRFFNNDNVTYPQLSAPLLQSAHKELAECRSEYGLVAHDWCRNNFLRHRAKTDKAQMSHDKDVGYELFASLLLSSENGQPLAPLGVDLTTGKGTYQCRQTEVQEKKPHLEQLVERIDWQERQGLTKPLVHLVDREADSAPHLRRLMKVKWLTRAKKGTSVKFQGEFITLEKLSYRTESDLKKRVNFRGKDAYLFVGEQRVELQRKSEKLAEAPPEVRLVISAVVDEHGKELAKWYLLSNVMDVSSETLATWYYWRWSIESWFKVLKSHGFQLEHWQQESGEAIFRRLIVSSMACVLVFKLYNDNSPGAAELKMFLVKLSGRLTKRSKPVTHPALLAGLWVFMQLNEVLNTYSMEEIDVFRDLASTIFGKLV